MKSLKKSAMPRSIDPSEIPEEVARFAEAQVAAGRFASVAEVFRAGKEALEQREAYHERVQALRRAGEEGLASRREHGQQLESDEEFEAFMDEAVADAHPHDWADYLRYRFAEGRKAIARGDWCSHTELGFGSAA